MLYPLALTQQVIPFFGCKGQLGYLSNFFIFNRIQFNIPPWCSDGQQSPLYTVSSAEQMIMLMKAHLFKDTHTATAIANAKSPSEAKTLGRRVQRFNEDIWNQYVCDIAYYALLAKFGNEQNQILRENLLNTGDAILAETTPYDKKWSIGTNPDDIRARHPHTFAGSNIQGYTLMAIRKTLSADNTKSTTCTQTQPSTEAATHAVPDLEGARLKNPPKQQPDGGSRQSQMAIATATHTSPGPASSVLTHNFQRAPKAASTPQHVRDNDESPEMTISDADSQVMESDDDTEGSHSKIILELCPDAEPGAITKSYIISPGSLNQVTTNDLGETSHTYTAQATRPTEILLILGRTPLQQARSQQLFIPEFLQSWSDTGHEDNSLLLLDDSRPTFAKKAGRLHAAIRITITDTTTTAEIRDCKRIIHGRPQSLPSAYRTRIIRPDYDPITCSDIAWTTLMSGDRIHVCPGPPTNGQEYTALQYQVTMHNHNPTDIHNRLPGAKPIDSPSSTSRLSDNFPAPNASTIPGNPSDNSNKQDKEAAPITGNASDSTAHPQHDATGVQQTAGNPFNVFTSSRREQKARRRFQHTSSEYPPPALFTTIDISAVVGPMGNGKSTHLMTLAKFLETENYRVIALKHAFDTRCAPDKIGTHDHQLLSGSAISSLPTSITNSREDEGVSSNRPELGAVVLALQSVGLNEDALLLCDNEAVLCVIRKWVGQGGKATLATAPDADILREIICLNDSMLELFGDARLESCSNLHRVLLTLNLKP